MTDLPSLVAGALADFEAAPDPAALENAKARYLGKAGLLTAELKSLGALAPDARREAGARINEAKARLEAALDARRDALADAKLAAALAAEAVDVSLPGRGAGAGGLHPLSLTLERVEALFATLGFEVADGPEIEDDFHNFTALNTPENHPARSMHDTFYVDGGLLLRTHTSPIQVRFMENARAADQDHRAGPRLPRRQRRDALADVPPGRGTVDRPRRVVRRPQGRGQPSSCAASSSATTSRCASARRSSPSPSPRSRST